MGKGGWKRKRKEKSSFLGWGHGFWPTPGASARAEALSAQGRPKSEGETARLRGRRHFCGPTCQRKGGRKRRRGQTAGRTGRAGEERLAAGELDGGLPPVARFFDQGRVVWHGWRLAIPTVGSIWSERVGRGLPTGRGRSSAAGIAAGGLWVGDGGSKVVLRVRGYVRELLAPLNFLPDHRRRRGRRRKGLTGEENDAGASRIVLGGGEERDGRGWCEEGGARGEPFIGARGTGGGGAAWLRRASQCRH
jgi:hypothetical protein